MSFLTELGNGFSAYGRAHKVLMQYKLGKYIVLPAFISLGYCIVYFVLAFLTFRGIEFDVDSLPWGLGWLGSASNWILYAFYWIFVIWLFFTTFKYVIQTILAPFLGSLSEAIEKKIKGGKMPDVQPANILSDILRAARLSIRNLIYEMLISFALSFLPGIGVILVFFVSAYYTGFGYMDYVLERRRYNTRGSVAFLKEHKGLAIGLGTPMNLALMVPVLGWMLAPTYATAAATLELLDLPPNPQKAVV